MRSVIPVVFLLLAGCGHPEDEGEPPDEKPTLIPGDPQVQALLALERETGTAWTVRFHPDLHTPAFLAGRTRPMIAGPAEAARVAREFLATYRDLFLMGDPAQELVAEDTVTDEIGMVHVGFRQRVGAVPVAGGYLAVHFDGEGALVRVHGRYVPVGPADIIPLVDRERARQIAVAAARAARIQKSPLSDLAFSVDTPALVVDPSRERPTLAWRVDAVIDDPEEPRRLDLWIDAGNGQVYRRDDVLDDLEGSGIGALGVRRTLQIAERNGVFYLENGHGGNPSQRTYTSGGGYRLPGRLVQSASRDRWDESGAGAGAAVDAHAHVAMVTDHLARVHGRAGARDDGQGLRATVHYGSGYANAFWNGRQVVFGDGDGRTLLPLAAALDIVAHEVAHAVIESSADLGHVGEAGALGEGIADLFGCFIEQAANGRRGNWRIGEDVSPRGALRDLGDPSSVGQPAHVSEQVVTTADRGGVHVNSGIPALAGYLMAEGGTHPVSGVAVVGLGVDATERIWYRAVTRYLRGGATFVDAADATVAAAVDLYGDGTRQVERVRRAWVAVGVLGE